MRHALLALLFTCFLLSGVSAKDDVWTPREFMTASGIDKMLAGIHTAVRAAANAPEVSQAAEAAKLREVWNEAVDATLSKEQLLQSFAQQIAGKMTSDELRAVRQFLDSDLGRRITQMENQTQEMEISEITKEGTEIAKTVSAKRAGMIKKLIELVGGVDSGLAMVMNSSFAMLKGMQAAGAIPLQVPDEELIGLLKKSEPQMRKQIGAQMALSSAVAYRDLSDQDLDTYLTFLRSDAGSAMYQKSLSALKVVLNESMSEFGSKLMTLMGHEKS